MKKRRLIAVLIAFIITVAATAMWSASTIVREGDPDAIVLEDSGSEAGTTEEQPQKKGGNKVVKVLTAPFKAVGRLFGRGGNDQNKIERMTEKDAERFESVGVTRIEDARPVKRVTRDASVGSICSLTNNCRRCSKSRHAHALAVSLRCSAKRAIRNADLPSNS